MAKDYRGGRGGGGKKKGGGGRGGGGGGGWRGFLFDGRGLGLVEEEGSHANTPLSERRCACDRRKSRPNSSL